MIKVKMSFEIDNDYINRIFGALDIKYDEKNNKIHGKYRDEKFELDGDEAGERIGQYLSVYCEFKGTGVEMAVEDLEANDDSRDGLLDDLMEGAKPNDY